MRIKTTTHDWALQVIQKKNEMHCTHTRKIMKTGCCRLGNKSLLDIKLHPLFHSRDVFIPFAGFFLQVAKGFFFLLLLCFLRKKCLNLISLSTTFFPSFSLLIFFFNCFYFYFLCSKLFFFSLWFNFWFDRKGTNEVSNTLEKNENLINSLFH